MVCYAANNLQQPLFLWYTAQKITFNNHFFMVYYTGKNLTEPVFLRVFGQFLQALDVLLTPRCDWRRWASLIIPDNSPHCWGLRDNNACRTNCLPWLRPINICLFSFPVLHVYIWLFYQPEKNLHSCIILQRSFPFYILSNCALVMPTIINNGICCCL